MCRSNDPIPEVQTSRPWQNAEWVRKVTVIRGSYSQSDDSFPTVTMFRQVPKLWYNGTINKSLGSQGWAYMILLQLKVLVLRVAVNKSKHRHDNGYPWISWITSSHHQPKCLRMSKTSTLPESNITPENWCFGDYFPLWSPGLFSGAMLVSVRVTIGEFSWNLVHWNSLSPRPFFQHRIASCAFRQPCHLGSPTVSRYWTLGTKGNGSAVPVPENSGGCDTIYRRIDG